MRDFDWARSMDLTSDGINRVTSIGKRARYSAAAVRFFADSSSRAAINAGGASSEILGPITPSPQMAESRTPGSGSPASCSRASSIVERSITPRGPCQVTTIIQRACAAAIRTAGSGSFSDSSKACQCISGLAPPNSIRAAPLITVARAAADSVRTPTSESDRPVDQRGDRDLGVLGTEVLQLMDGLQSPRRVDFPHAPRRCRRRMVPLPQPHPRQEQDAAAQRQRDQTRQSRP